jgi:hypothetical protein
MLVIFVGCTPAQRPILGFKPELKMSDMPVIGRPIQLTLTFITHTMKGLEGKNVYYVARISLPDSVFEVIEGDIEMRGPIIGEETHKLELTLKSVRTVKGGEIWAYVSLHFSPNEAGGYGDQDYLIVSIGEDSATVGYPRINNSSRSGWGCSCY